MVPITKAMAANIQNTDRALKFSSSSGRRSPFTSSRKDFTTWSWSSAGATGAGGAGASAAMAGDAAASASAQHRPSIGGRDMEGLRLPQQREDAHPQVPLHLDQLAAGDHLAVDGQLHRLSRDAVEVDHLAYLERHHLLGG